MLRSMSRHLGWDIGQEALDITAEHIGIGKGLVIEPRGKSEKSNEHSVSGKSKRASAKGESGQE